MNKLNILVTSILVALSLLLSITTTIEADNRWTGTIHMDQTYSGGIGKSERHVTLNFTNTLPTYYRDHEGDPDTYTDDKGTGSHTFHVEAIIVGKKYSTTDCTGNGKGNLMQVIIDQGNKTYEIGANSPECKGKTVSLINGVVEDYGPDVVPVHVPPQKMTDPNVFTGTWSETIDTGAGPVTTTVTWNLSKGKAPDIELIVTPANYDKWLPTPGKDELFKGSVLEVSFKLQAHGGGSPAKKVETFDVRLSQTSKEPGITLNAPLKPSSTQLPDLRLLPHPLAESIKDDQFLNVKSQDGITGKTYIASYDGGGYSILTVEAILEDKRRIQGHLLVPTGDTDITIPKRLPKLNIATAWANANGNPQDNDDKEKSSGNSNDGDGFSAYEEYRGVISEDKFKRLDPQEKELGIRLFVSEIPLLSDGITLFEAASGLTVIRFHNEEVPFSRQVNHNSGTSYLHGAFAIPLMKGTLPPGGAGNTYSTTGNIEIPKRSTAVVISLKNIGDFYKTLPKSAPYMLNEVIASTIAHELSHSVDVPHHGDMGAPPTPTANDKTFMVLDMFGKDVTYKVQYPLEGAVGLPGSAESGDMSCVMAYNPYYSWALTVDGFGRKIYSEVPLMPLGRSMCKSRVGTGINAPSATPGVPNRYFGKATIGNCLSKIKLWEPD